MNEFTAVDPGTNPGIQGYANLGSALDLKWYFRIKTYTKISTCVA